ERVPAGDRRARGAVGGALGGRRPRGVLRPAARCHGRRRRRLHRRPLAVEGGRRAARARAAPPPRRHRTPPHGGAARDRRRRGLMARELLVGVDVGTTYCKAVVLDADGCELAQARVRTPWTRVATGAELDPHAIVAAVLSVAAQAVADTPEGA